MGAKNRTVHHGISMVLRRCRNLPLHLPLLLPMSVLFVVGVRSMEDYLPDHYTPDGSRNHPRYPQRGTAGSPRIREHPPYDSYDIDDAAEGDGPSWRHPRLDLPSPRRILVELFQNVPPRRNERASQLMMSFGHYVVRDVTRTLSFNASAPMPIECDLVETRGPFCPEGQKLIEFYRTLRVDGEDSGNLPSDTGEPINHATTWLDMDNTYGSLPPSSPDYLKYRTGEGGRMKLDTATGLPPLDENGLYLVYDQRMRMLPEDLMFTATFLHYHNRRADLHREKHPEWDDETIYWKARMDVTAAYQSIFEEKYVPATLGEPLRDYGGYDADVDASIDVFFSTCSFRYGHSSVGGLVRLLDNEFEVLPQDPLLLRDVFNQTERVLRRLGGGRSAVSAIVRGLIYESTKAPDASFVDDMTLFIQGNVPRNIQRGRDNGLPSYNDAREWFGLEKKASYLDLVDGDETLAKALEGLYGAGNIDNVDPYVGAMLESPASKHDELGPLNEASLRDQFERLRDGDRLYYKARLSEDELEQLPTLAELMRWAWGEEEMKYFPEDAFARVTSIQSGSAVTGGSLALFDGDLSVEWEREEAHIDFTMSSPEEIRGGYVGLGWGASTMLDSEIWFCESKGDPTFRGDSCFGDDGTPLNSPDPGPFTCCVAPGSKHVKPTCGGNNYLTVLASCASSFDGSHVTVRAQLCSPIRSSNCFDETGTDLEFIAAYNPSVSEDSHGFSRRTSGSVNLSRGIAATCSNDSAQAGLYALHGATMLVAWLIITPIAIYVVRYKKDKRWRLKVHITLVGIVGGLMFTLVTAAIISVEGTSFGTEDAVGAIASKHKQVGLVIIIFVLYMIGTGELRRRRIFSKRISATLEHVVLISHRFGGLVMISLAWFNCYTGLRRIQPYEDDSVEITLLSGYTTDFQNGLKVFSVIRKYIFWPWIGVIVLVFIGKEFHVRRAQKLASKNQHEILTKENDGEMPTMTVETFLFLTKHGSSLTIIDGYVLDIGTFRDIHPGGTKMLRFAIGSDITPYFLGEMDVDGRRHQHSPNALRALRPLVKSKLESAEGDDRVSVNSTSKSRASRILNKKASHISEVFRGAMVVEHKIVLPPSGGGQKYTIQLSISMSRDDTMDSRLGAPLPTSTFIFRAIDSKGNFFERPYTTYRCHLKEKVSDERQASLSRLGRGRETVLPTLRRSSKVKEEANVIVYKFYITIVPDGQMSKVLAKKTVGKRIMVKGPLIDKATLDNLEQEERENVCIVTLGTGVVPGLQLADFYLMRPNPPKVTLLWCLRDSDGSFRHELGLADRESSSEHFRYLVLTGVASLSETDAPLNTFLQLYQGKSLCHSETVEALLSWVSQENELDVQIDCDQRNGNDLANLNQLGQKLKAGLPRSFCGYDVISYLVDQGYVPSRDVALAVVRDLDDKLNLFRRGDGATDSPFQDTTHMYSFNPLVRFRGNGDASRDQSLLIALCGHVLFEDDMEVALTRAGIHESQILRFREGATAMSRFTEASAHRSSSESQENGNETRPRSSRTRRFSVLDKLPGIKRKENPDAMKSDVFTKSKADLEMKKWLSQSVVPDGQLYGQLSSEDASTDDNADDKLLKSWTSSNYNAVSLGTVRRKSSVGSGDAEHAPEERRSSW